MSYTVIFTPEAEAQLVELYEYIAAKASPEIAARFADGIMTYCESLCTFLPVETDAMIFAPVSVLRAIESVSPSHFISTMSESISLASFTAAMTMKQTCSTRNEGTRQHRKEIVQQPVA